MTNIQCPHCHAFSSDEEFCDNCGRAIVMVGEPSSYTKDKWSPQLLNCETILTKDNLKEQFKLFESPYIEIPLISINEESLFRNYYLPGKVTLEDYFKKNQTFSFDIVHSIICSIGKIIGYIQSKNYGVGGINLADFWIDESNISTITYRPLQPFIPIGERADEYFEFDFYSKEYQNKEPLSYSSDVMIIGSLFISLMMHRLVALTSMTELRYIAHQMIVQREDYPTILHSWIERSTNIYAESRFVNVDEQMNYYHECLNTLTSYEILDFSINGLTDDGIGKRAASPNLADVNQDRFFHSQNEHIAFALVADGISTAKYGTGSLAAQITEDMAKSMWNQHSTQLENEEAILDFLHQFIVETNQAIIKQSYEIAKNEENVKPSELMGSTVVATIIHKNYAYTVSIGDSRIYKWSPLTGIQLLHMDQNVRNELLEQGVEWTEIQKIDDQNSLTNYLGMAKTNTDGEPFISRDLTIHIRKTPVSAGEVIFLCSDGVTDYLYPLGYQNDFWKIDTILDEKLTHYAGPEADWTSFLQSLIDSANENGGGDNITALIIELKEQL